MDTFELSMEKDAFNIIYFFTSYEIHFWEWIKPLSIIAPSAGLLIYFPPTVVDEFGKLTN